jgi:hypothetical protein
VRVGAVTLPPLVSCSALYARAAAVGMCIVEAASGGECTHLGHAAADVVPTLQHHHCAARRAEGRGCRVSRGKACMASADVCEDAVHGPRSDAPTGGALPASIHKHEQLLRGGSDGDGGGVALAAVVNVMSRQKHVPRTHLRRPGR